MGMKNAFFIRFVVVFIFAFLINTVFLGACMSPGPTATNPLPTLTSPPTTTSTSTPIPTETPLPPSSTPDIRTVISDKDYMHLLYVPAGEFTMGSENGFDDERPAHPVYLDEFWIDQTEVTVQMYALCVKAGKCKAPVSKGSFRYSNYYGNPQFESYPVIHIDWKMAKTYCEWAGRRLPTEAEWEKAARGEQALTYPWGNEEPNKHLLNFNKEMGDVTAVGSYPNGASPYGVLDMAGNAWEWVADWYSETYYASSPASNPRGRNSGQERVLRGGAWLNDFTMVRSSNRNSGVPDDACVSCGFRCAVSQ
jgi:eukaryotic-like serine/threonine-protein kinase